MFEQVQIHFNIVKKEEMLTKLKSKTFIGFTKSVIIMFSILSFYPFRATTAIIVESEEEMLSVLEDSITIQMDGQLKVSEIDVSSLANNIKNQKIFYRKRSNRIRKNVITCL